MTFTRAGPVVLDVALKRKTSTGLERPEMSWGEALAAAKLDWPAETLNPKTWFGDAMVTLKPGPGSEVTAGSGPAKISGQTTLSGITEG